MTALSIKAVLFDLDGTLTVPYLDFDAIRAEIGGIEGPILEAMERMSSEQRQRANEILLGYEARAAHNAELNDGVFAMLADLRKKGLKTAIVTRNHRENVEIVCNLHKLDFDVIVTREDGPVKPDAFPVLLACEKLKVSPEKSVMVGDYLFDIVSGNDAGAHTVLLANHPDSDSFSHRADFIIEHLGDLPGIIFGILCK